MWTIEKVRKIRGAIPITEDLSLVEPVAYTKELDYMDCSNPDVEPKIKQYIFNLQRSDNETAYLLNKYRIDDEGILANVLRLILGLVMYVCFPFYISLKIIGYEKKDTFGIMPLLALLLEVLIALVFSAGFFVLVLWLIGLIGVFPL